MQAKCLLFALFLLVFVGLWACAPAEESDEPRSNQDIEEEEEEPDVTTSDGELYRVRIENLEAPLPYQELFSLELFIDDRQSGDALSGLLLEPLFQVEGTSPVMPTHPLVVDLGDGTYRVDGILLHVPKRWQMSLRISDGERQDRARIDLGVVGQYLGELPRDPTGLFDDEDLRHILMMSPMPLPPPDPTNQFADDEEAAILGQALFFDAQFSKDGTVACASCHSEGHGFSDPNRLSRGVGETNRRAMPVSNAAYQRWAFWDGRADSLWAQALGPIENEVEHGITRVELVRRIFEDEELRQPFEDLFGELPDMDDLARFPAAARPVVDDPEHPHHQAWREMSEADRDEVDRAFSNFGKAIAAFERQIIGSDAPFDRFVRALREGDETGLGAISEQAQRGLKVFLNDGRCVDCHGGHQFSNFEFHNLGLGQRSWLPEEVDAGRSQGLLELKSSPFNAAGPYSDAPNSAAAERLEYLPEPDFMTDGAFKTPTLRDVAKRAPYMHGGHFASLEEVMDFYSDLQEDSPVGLRDPLLQQVNLAPEDIQALVAFMESLSGEELFELPSP